MSNLKRIIKEHESQIEQMRSEEIDMYGMQPNDVSYLIERVQELEEHLEKNRAYLYKCNTLNECLEQQNRRYRESIKRMKIIPNDVNSDWDYVQHIKSIINELEE